jgi:hypothetical protein
MWSYLEDPRSSSNTSSVPPGEQSGNTPVLFSGGRVPRWGNKKGPADACFARISPSCLPPGACRMHVDEKDTSRTQKAAVSFCKDGSTQTHLLGSECSCVLFPLSSDATIYSSITVRNPVLIPCSKDSISLRCLHVVRTIEHVIAISASLLSLYSIVETGIPSPFLITKSSHWLLSVA